MNNNDMDSRLRKLFAETRRLDALRAPAFQRLTDTPPLGRDTARTSSWLGSRRLIAAVAALSVLGIALVVLRSAPQQPAAGAQQWAAFSSWQASTDALLGAAMVSGQDRFATPTDSWINTAFCVSDAGQASSKEDK